MRARVVEICTSGVARALTLESRTLTCQIEGIVLEEVLDLSFDWLLMMMMMMIYRESRNPNVWRSAVIIINSVTTAHFGTRPSSDAFAISPYFLRHSSNFFLPTSWHHPSLHIPILVYACPFAFFLLLLKEWPFLQCSGPPVGWHVLPKLGG